MFEPDLPSWHTDDRGAMVMPGEWLGGFDFSDDHLWERLYWRTNVNRNGSYVDFELVPEPWLTFGLGTGVLCGAAWLRRRVR
jgi:hypothetical protein